MVVGARRAASFLTEETWVERLLNPQRPPLTSAQPGAQLEAIRSGAAEAPGPAVNPAWVVRTGRLVLTPVGWPDLADLIALKGDPSAYAQMLGGVCSPARVHDELAADQAFWARRGVGMWAVRGVDDPALIGLTGLHDRPDGLGVALRFAFRPETRGRGVGREAASAALRFAHERARLAVGDRGTRA